LEIIGAHTQVQIVTSFWNPYLWICTRWYKVIKMANACWRFSKTNLMIFYSSPNF